MASGCRSITRCVRRPRAGRRGTSRSRASPTRATSGTTSAQSWSRPRSTPCSRGSRTRTRVAQLPPGADGAATPGALAAAGSGRFELSGDVGFVDAARLLDEGDTAFAGLERVEVDLARVARVDSAGLALLLEWSLSSRAAGRTLRYQNIPPAVASLAGISEVAELLAPSSGG